VPSAVSRRALCYGLAAIASVPAWVVRYAPLQDLPLHASTIRILASFRDSAYGFADNYVLTLGRTQYLLYHVAGALLARIWSPHVANGLLISTYLSGTVLALQWLVREIGEDERLCLLVVPLLVNVPFILGLLPFLLGVTIMFAAVAATVRYVRAPSPALGALVAALTLALFYSHVVPFLLFGVAYVALLPWRHPKAWLRMLIPWAPAAPVVLWWAGFTTAGRVTRGVLFDLTGGSHKAFLASVTDFYRQVGDVFTDTSDRRIFVAAALVAAAAAALWAGERPRTTSGNRAYAALPVACIVCYFALAEGHDYVFFVAQRFAVLFAMTAIPLLRMPSGWRGHAVAFAVTIVALTAVVNTTRHFQRFEAEELGDFEGALRAMTPARRVCALVYDPSSRIVRNAAFLHFGSYYQSEKGGVVMFSYAGYPHWPVDFAAGRYPPPGRPARPRWEWMPERVAMTDIYPYYDYVLTRGPGFAPPPGTYREVWHDDRWAVWTRV